MMWLTKCFCTLKTGSLLAGAWTLLTATLNISLEVLNIMSMENLEENLTSYQVKDGHIPVKSRKILASLEILFGVALVDVSLLLFIAVIKGRRKLLFPYIVTILLYNIFDFSLLMFYFGKGVQIESSLWISDLAILWINIDSSLWIPNIAILFMNIYCLLTVLSLNNKITKTKRWLPKNQIDFFEY